MLLDRSIYQTYGGIPVIKNQCKKSFYPHHGIHAAASSIDDRMPIRFARTTVSRPAVTDLKIIAEEKTQIFQGFAIGVP